MALTTSNPYISQRDMSEMERQMRDHQHRYEQAIASQFGIGRNMFGGASQSLSVNHDQVKYAEEASKSASGHLSLGSTNKTLLLL